MTVYYITPPDSSDTIALDSTSVVKLEEAGKTTSLPLESGESVADHYINANTKISFSGVISTEKSNSSAKNKSPEEYINTIRELKKSGKTFTVNFSDKINALVNCVFTSISFEQTTKHGTDGVSSSYKVVMSMKQVRFVKAAQITTETSGLVKDASSEKVTSGKGTQETSAARNARIGAERIKSGNTLIDKSGFFD